MTQSWVDTRVVELASYAAAPSATLTLAQLGADVIKVEPIGGMPDRGRWPLSPSGRSLFWASLNRGKRSIGIDIKKERGQELVVALAGSGGTRGGVLVDNIGPAPWLERETLRSARADLIHARIVGRPDGSRSLDYIANAAVGLPLMTGKPGAQPTDHVLPAWDLLTGQYVAVSVLAALLRRASDGQGADLTLNLEDVAVAAVANLGWATEAHTLGDRDAQGNYVYGAFGVDFKTRDERRVMVVALGDRQWAALCEATGTANVFEAITRNCSIDLASDGDRFEARSLIAAVLENWFSDHTAEEATHALAKVGVPCGLYRGMAEQVALRLKDADRDPMLSVVHDQFEIAEQVVTRFPAAGISPSASIRPAPELGAHTVEVLSEVLGLTSAEVGALLDEGIVFAGGRSHTKKSQPASMEDS